MKLLLHTYASKQQGNHWRVSQLLHIKHDVKFGCFLTSASDIFTSLSFWTELFSFTFRPSFLPSSFLRIWRYNIQSENINPHILQTKHIFLTNNHKIFRSRQRGYLSRSIQFFTKIIWTKIINIQLQGIIYFLR